MPCLALHHHRQQFLGFDQQFKWNEIYDSAQYFKVVKQVYRELRKYPSIASVATSTPSGTLPGNGAFIGSVLLPDGRLYLCPADTNFTTTARIYDPFSNTLSTPGGTFPVFAKSAFLGAVLMRDGRVFCIPSQSTTARIYDPKTDSLSIPSPVFPGSGNQFLGGTLLQDGRIFLSPHQSLTGRIYDPRNDTLFTTVALNSTALGSAGCMLLRDGRVLLVPYNHTAPRIYNPWLDTVSVASGSTVPGTEDLVGAVSILGGDVFMPVALHNQIGIYSEISQNFNTVNGSFGAGYAHLGGASLPDGRIIMAAGGATQFRVYSPFTGGFQDVLSNGTSFGFYGAHLLPNGSVYAVPHNSTTARTFLSGSVNRSIDINLCLSPIYNVSV